MNRLAGLLGAASSLLAFGGVHAQSSTGDQVIAANAANWVNSKGYAWAYSEGRSWWQNVSPVNAPASFPFIGSQVVYGPPSGIAPAQPTAVESLVAVNCGGPGSEPQIVIMQFNQTVKKTATTQVTHGWTTSEAVTLQASVPSWGVGISETSTVSYTTSTSSTTSTTISYSYGYQDQVTLGPGLKQTASLMVDFQDTVIPWSANLVYNGNDVISYDVTSWMNFQIEPNGRGEQAANYFNDAFQGITLKSVLAVADQTLPLSGTFTGVSGSQGTAVNGPTQELTPADKAQYCGGITQGRAAARTFRVAPVALRR